MVEMTMSFSKGKKNETSIKHNNRSIEPDFDFDKKGHQHIKPKFTPMNEILIHDDIKRVYEQEFGSAVQKYNAKQKRKDRRIENYYQKVKHAKNMRTQYEFLVQVGNKSDFETDKNRTTSQLWQNGKKILENYYQNFQKRNPNLRVYNAVIHMDEEGAPHMHLNVVPVAHLKNVKRGLTVKPSLNQALAEEGFAISKKDNRKQFRDFQHREADALAQEARIFGINRKAGIVNKLKDVHEYKKAMREIDEVEVQLSNSVLKKDDANRKLLELSQQVKEKEKQLNQLNSNYEQKKRYLDQQLQERIDSHNRQLQTMSKVLKHHRVTSSEDYIVTGPFGKVDKEATAKRIEHLQKAVASSKDIREFEKNQADEVMKKAKQLRKPKVLGAKQMQQKIAEQEQTIQTQQVTISTLRREVDGLKKEITAFIETTRDVFANSKERIAWFFQQVGKKMQKRFGRNQAAKYGFDEHEKQNLDVGMQSARPKPRQLRRGFDDLEL